MAMQPARSVPSPKPARPARPRATPNSAASEPIPVPPEFQRRITPDELRASLAAALAGFESGQDPGTPLEDVLAELSAGGEKP